MRRLAVILLAVLAEACSVLSVRASIPRRHEFFRRDAQLGRDVVACATGTLFVAKASEAPGYDGNAALASDSRFAYSWDGLGRLAEAVCETAPGRRVAFDYYPDGRRAAKRVYARQGQSWALLRTHQFYYDGWNLSCETVLPAGAPQAALRLRYLWGPDLAGQRDGSYGQAAGGIVGLLAVTATSNGVDRVYLPVSDGLGNVRALVDAQGGAAAADYAYDPYGAPLEVGGTAAGMCPFRFQTKYYDAETGLYYFGYRYYDPMSCKWLCRDPKGEAGGVNLTAYCENDPVNGHDPWGLDKWNNTLANEMAEISTPYWFLYSRPPAPPQTPPSLYAAPLPEEKVSDLSGRKYFRDPFTQSLADHPRLLPLPPMSGDPVEWMRFYGSVNEPGRRDDCYKDLAFQALHVEEALLCASLFVSDGASSIMGGTLRRGAASLTERSILAEVGGLMRVRYAPRGIEGAFDGLATAESEANVVYRALNSKDASRLEAGLGLEAKNPAGAWNVGEHIALGSGKASWANDPWLATTRDLNVARGFDSGKGIVAIDLSKVSSTRLKAWELYPRANGEAGLPYHYSIWQREISVFQNVPKEAVIGFVK